MGNDTMDLMQLATYLQRDLRELTKLASRGHLPGRKVSGEWRFARAEINHWLETQMPVLSEKELTALEITDHCEIGEPLLTTILTEATVSVPLPASTRTSVLKELVTVAEQSWHVYDPEAILEAIRQREETASTALPSGVAIPHPHRQLASALGEHVIAYGRTSTTIPFGGARGTLTDIFFLVCCRDDRTHLRVLARLSRLLMRPELLDQLRSADTPTETWLILHAAEKELLGLA